jgi:hypothetical protein
MSGFPSLICHSVGDMVRKVNRGHFPLSKAMRRYVIDRYTTAKMTDGYLKIYNKIRRGPTFYVYKAIRTKAKRK